MGIRERIERDLSKTLEGDFSLPIKLMDPDGDIQDVRGQVLYFSTKFDPETGGDIRLDKPNCTVRLSSLTRVPVDGEPWLVTLPVSPLPTAELKTYSIENASVNGKSFGWITLFCTNLGQS